VFVYPYALNRHRRDILFLYQLFGHELSSVLLHHCLNVLKKASVCSNVKRLTVLPWVAYGGSTRSQVCPGAMVKGQQASDGKWYYLDHEGKMATDPVMLTPDLDGALQYPVF